MAEQPNSLSSWAARFAGNRGSNRKIGEKIRWDLLFISILDSLIDERSPDGLVDHKANVDSVLWNYSAFLLRLKRHFPAKFGLRTEPFSLLVSPYARNEVLAFLKDEWEARDLQPNNVAEIREAKREGIAQYVSERGYADLMKTRRSKENRREFANFKR